ncbi:MAG: 30S ribosomal protein S12 methylthiotransferase RimO [Phycisphaeraceae bacterium]|nr:30S ribosomal protein S12 methylthiotransferase RimO [Phycisphaeraceae bacterium]
MRTAMKRAGSAKKLSTKAETPGKGVVSRRAAGVAKSAEPKRAAGAGVRKPRAERDTAVRTVSFVSLGCPKNLVDSEKMLGLLAQDGLAIVSADVGEDAADAVVINTCGFLEASKDESLQVIQDALRAKEAGRVKRVVVAGCLVQRHRAKILEWAPGIDAMVGVFDRDHIVEAVRGGSVRATAAPTADPDAPRYWIAGNALVAAKERGVETAGLTVQGKDGKGIGYFEDDSARLRITPRHYAYLRVSEGCNQNCAFCTIPSIRGKMRSKPMDRIAAEARELVADGAFELNLIGQDTTSYGDDIGAGLGLGKGVSARLAVLNGSGAGAGSGAGSAVGDAKSRGLPGMLRSVVEAMEHHGVAGWVRLMYAYPSNFSDEMIDAIAELSWVARGGKRPGVLPYIDIPLQHASDHMLTAMRRNVTASHQLGLMRKLRERVPGMSVRTTFISGFPGETEDDHKQLLEFVEEVGFEAVGVFEYSKEEGTVAGTMEDDASLAVPAEVKARRRGEVMELQQRIAFERAKGIAAKFDAARPVESGTRFDVLIDAPMRTQGRATSGVSAGGGLYQGRTYFQAPMVDSVTFVHSKRKLSAGELVRCVVVDADGYDLIARPVEELEKRVGLRVVG